MSEDWITYEGLPPKDGYYLTRMDEDDDEPMMVEVYEGRAYGPNGPRVFMNFEWKRLHRRTSPVANDQGEVVAYTFQCPGCKTSHIVHTRHATAAVWSFNGDLERPTFAPSVLVNRDHSHPDLPRCHSFVVDGFIQFLNDCTHDLRGETVELPEVDD